MYLTPQASDIIRDASTCTRPVVGEWSQMLIDEQFRKCVALLWVDVHDPLTGAPKSAPSGTAFFVSVPAGPDKAFLYVVTALHVVYNSRPYGLLKLRLNLVPGPRPTGSPEFVDLAIAPDAWIEHPTTDVAVARMGRLDLSVVDLRYVGIDMLASSNYAEAQRIGVGDEVFFAGLFSPHPGQERFQPIVRFGNISMMPHEKVTVEIIPKTPVAIDAYLIEARSWGGHSGSPTFIYYPPDRNPGSLLVGGSAPALLGLVSGHFPVPAHGQYARDSLDSTLGSANAGIAVIVPSQAIIELLMSDDLVEERREVLGREHAQAPSPVAPDAAPPPDR